MMNKLKKYNQFRCFCLIKAIKKILVKHKLKKPFNETVELSIKFKKNYNNPIIFSYILSNYRNKINIVIINSYNLTLEFKNNNKKSYRQIYLNKFCRYIIDFIKILQINVFNNKKRLPSMKTGNIANSVININQKFNGQEITFNDKTYILNIILGKINDNEMKIKKNIIVLYTILSNLLFNKNKVLSITNIFLKSAQNLFINVDLNLIMRYSKFLSI